MKPLDVGSRKSRERRAGFFLLVVIALTLLVVFSLRDRGTRIVYRQIESAPPVLPNDSAPPPEDRAANYSISFNSRVEKTNSATTSDPIEFTEDFDPVETVVYQPTLPATALRPTAYGVVDMARLIAAYHPMTNSSAELQGIVNSIKRRVASRATTHGLTFVFDVSARMKSGDAFIMETNRVSDLTEEVLQTIRPTEYTRK